MSIRSSLSFIQRLWPRLLYGLIVVAIALAAGPEVFAAVEMVTLLELLGATLFLTAYAAGVKLILTSCQRAVYDLVVPSLAYFVLGPRRDQVWAAPHIAFYALWWVAFALTLGAFGRHR